MRYLTAEHLADLLGQVTAEDMQIVLSQAFVKTHGVCRDLSQIDLQAGQQARLLLQDAAWRAMRAIRIAELLSRRELEVALLLHFENIKIAAMLDVTTYTVKAHVRAALAKTGAETRTELALLVRGIQPGISPWANTATVMTR